MVELDSQGRKLQEVLEFWLISAPGEPTPQQTFDTLNSNLTKNKTLGSAYKFHIPDLKVGTLDILVGLAEELEKLDVFIESVTRKIAQYLGDVLEDEKDKLKENLLVHRYPPAQAVTKFQWDIAKYPVKQSLRNITDSIAKNATQTDVELKAKAQMYNSVRTNIQNIERKSTGSLMSRNLSELVKKEDVVQESEYLVTLLIVISSGSQREWFAKYETLCDMVVPRSSRIITQDSEHILVTATVFTKVIDEFKLHCRENRFIVRDFQFNESEIEASRKEVTKLAAEKKKQFSLLVRWLKVNFSETFSAWLHVKALRIFVESVLRFGLPVNFQAILVAPPKKAQKRLREFLNEHYKHLESSALQNSKNDNVEIPGLNISMGDYYPYIYFKVGVDMVEQLKF